MLLYGMRGIVVAFIQNAVSNKARYVGFIIPQFRRGLLWNCRLGEDELVSSDSL